MQTIILCGGLGTRMREETEYRPKPMVEIGGRPVLWHIMKTYAHFGHKDFVLCLGYKGQVIKEYFLNYEALNNNFSICLGKSHEIQYLNGHEEQDFKVTLVDTGQETMTGGRIKRVEQFVAGDEFLVTYGDGLADVDVNRLLAFHRSHGKIATLTTVKPQSRFGVLDVNDAGGVEAFAEKPTLEGWIAAGYFVFNRGLFKYLDGGDSCILERSPLERLVADGQLMAYRHGGFFFAMDTYRDYLAVNEMWDNGRAPWKVWK